MPLQINNDDASFNVLFHHNPNPMWIVEVDTLQFKEVNDAAIKHYGYCREEFLNQITLSNIRPVHEQQDMLALIKRIKHSQTIKKDLTHVKKDGSVIYVNITSYNVTYYGCRCRMVIINDITLQKHKDIKLTEALDKINETLESITDGFITLDRKLRITYWNKEAERILATDRAAVLHKTLWQLYPYYRELNVFKRFNYSLDHKETIKFEEHIPQLNKWVCFTVYPGSDGLAVYFQDISGQKHGEEQINLKNKSLDQIAYINSHLIRKPLANILGIINSLECAPHDEEHLEQPLKMLKLSAVELDHIIKDINTRVEKTLK
ncbi:PAS domain S-box protein [Mucilaginibacter terrigena]|uniref:histidine kinase n=1 Tax=Mucilaginibacter terrigena TaxID=2492395 RepID=A0A4Q5LK40_9SPHI|nr:PAS domain-containing protein [Mucilaginibacter terrigena]RYU90044.1 PAS domain S-box protein [Mucilaginibacter terrigena]